ncbi:MAG: DUF2298 domain-containing protein, partial [Ilumatobacteraceae bacterium]
SRRIPTEFSLMTNVGRWPLVVIAGATVLPFSYIIITSLPTGRYFIPMLPGLYAIAGLGVVAALRWARGLRGFPRAAAAGFAAISVGLALIWGVAFVNGIYGHKNTRIEASEWIAANVPRGSVLSSQAWDDGLPLRLPGLDAEAFTSEQFNMVGPDDEAKVARIAEQIGRIDYVVESSPRIWATVTRMPARFPSTIKFFDGLESGVLGFERVATFRSGLALGPWRLDDSSADEAFSVLDHPEVRIWRKVRTVDRDAVVKVLDPVAASNAVAIDPNRASANGLMLRPDEIAANSRGPTYDAAFATDDSGVIQVIQVIGWFALLELFGLAAFALFVPLLQRLPDGGLGLAKILALSCLSFGLFIAATWFRLALDRTVVVAVVSLFLAVGALSAWRRHALIATMWRERRTVLITVEVLGAVMFVAFVGIRAMNPDLWHPDRGGEKPFELALLTAVLRTRTIPVYDPWFSGGALNYYYGGWLMLSVPARLLRTSPALVMNLALGVFASCSSGAAFSLASGMVNASRTRWRRRSRTQRTSVVAGLLAAAFVLLASNAAILSPLRQRVSGGSAPGERVDWWALSRVIPNSVTITEFPAWSLLYGDVHPHLMGIAALLALAALCVAWHGALTDGRRRHAVTIAMLLGITAGLIRMTNTWDFPLSLGLVAATLGAALVARTPWRRCVLPAAVLLITVIVVWSPYTGRGEIFDSAFDPATLRTPPSSWLEHFGPFAAIAVFVIALHLAESFAESRVVWWSLTNAHLTVLGLSMIALGYIALRPGFEVFEITAALTIGCAWVALRCWQIDTPRSCSQFGPLGPLAMAIGWLIQACVEMLTVRNDAGRMNTVFKFWFESWVVLAVGGAVVVAEQMRTRMRRRLFGLAFVGFALFVSAAFWWMSTPVRMDDRVSAKTLSLNGEAYLRDDFIIGDGKERFVPADDLPLINWIRANVRGIRVIAEAPGNDYRWTARISWFTGLPTPIGWSYHETQQRRPYAATIEARRTDLNELYTTTDPEAMARVLSRYSVAFVVFGTQERLIASDSSATALRAFPCLDVVTESDRSSEDGVDPNELFVAAVDAECVIRLRPPLAPPPPSS